MDRLKYIVFKLNADLDMGSGELIVIFPAVIPHSTMGMNRRIGEPISAGFLTRGVFGSGGEQWFCHGDSETLKLKARPKEDAALANRMYV